MAKEFRRTRRQDKLEQEWREKLEKSFGKRLLLILSLAIGGLSALIYGFTLYPTVPGGDSGELIAVAHTLGVAHPPGYPLYTMLAKLSTIIPWGSIAWRVNLLSGILDAIAAGLLCWAAGRFARNAWAGFLAGGIYAFSPLTWTYATSAEVFALNNATLAFMLWLAVRFDESPSQGLWRMTALAAGLGVSNHHISVFLSVPLLVWMGFRLRPSPTRWLQMAAFGLAGLLPYVYLPIAYRTGSPVSWGDISSVSGFLDHFLRRDYGTFQLGATDAKVGLFHNLWLYFRELPRELLYLGLVLAGFGVVGTARESGARLGVGRVVLLSLAGFVLVFHTLANLPLEKPLIQGVVARFWQQPNLLLCFFSAPGIVALARTMVLRYPEKEAIFLKALPAVAVAAVVLQLGIGFREMDQHKNTTFRDFGRAILEPLPQGSILFSLGDLESNTTRYLQLCEGLRPDVRILDRAMLVYPWFRGVASRNFPEVNIPPGPFNRRPDPRPGHFRLVDLFDRNLGQAPIFISEISPDEDKSWGSKYASWPFGIADRIVPKGSPMDLGRYVEESRLERSKYLDRGMYHLFSPKSWEQYAWSKYWEAEARKGFQLLLKALEHPEERGPFELAASTLEMLIQERPDPVAPDVLKNAGLAFRHLSTWKPEATGKMVHYWERYLASQPKDDLELPEIRRVLAASRGSGK